MTPSNCPYCHAPLPAARSGAIQPVILCPACGKAIVTAGPAVGGSSAGKLASPAKTLMWTGGFPAGVGVKSSAPAAAATTRLGTPAADKPVSPGAAASPPGYARGDAKPAAYSAVAAAAAAKRRVETADFAVAPTMVPPPPDAEGPSARVEVRPTADARGPAAVDVDISSESRAAPAGGVTAAADSAAAATAADAGAGSTPEDAPSPVPADDKGRNGAESESEAVPEWAGSAPSMGTAARLKGGQHKYFFVAGGVGVVALAVLGVVVLGGKKQSGSEQKPAPVKAAEKAAVPTPPLTVEKPALPAPAAAVEPAKPQPAVAEKAAAPAASKPAAVEKVAAPVEKPAPSEKAAVTPRPAVEKPRPVEKKVAAEKPALAERRVSPKPVASPKPVVEKPVAEKVAAPSEPAAPPPEKKQAEAAPPVAKPATDKTQEAAEAYQRGNARLLNGALPEAIAAFSESLKLNPKDPQSQRGLGMAYAQSGNAAQAVRHFKLYLKASPSAPDRALIEKRISQLGGR